MLKVVGASWLQTRISTYILVAVALLGIGAIILGEFGHVEKDGTYSATVSWNHKGGYRIDFWGQGNDLKAIPLNAARAYYKTGIFETGWSIIEIETSAKYPDMVQAYAAGLLEGSLTWQLIHHHWYNTVGTVCERKATECRKLTRYLRENSVIVRERAMLLEATDPFWHMVRLFYVQLDGLEAGWRFAVRRSRQSVEMESEDFLWLAVAADLSSKEDLKRNINASDGRWDSKGSIFVKTLQREHAEPLIAIGHNTAAPYVKMLRLLKRYKFGYHLLPAQKGGAAAAAQVPARSVVMSSYPGALSSHDEFYMVQIGENRELIVAGTPLAIANRSLLTWNSGKISKDLVMSPIGVMAANRLTTDSRSWTKVIALKSINASNRQWVIYEPRASNIWLVEQLPGITHAADYTQELLEDGFLSCTGMPHFREIKDVLRQSPSSKDDITHRRNLILRTQENVTTLEHVRRFMRGIGFSSSASNNSSQLLAYRGDMDETVRQPVGVIDAKIIATDIDGFVSFEITSGPATSDDRPSFAWSKTFPNVSHVGHPDSFNFDSIVPIWVWA